MKYLILFSLGFAAGCSQTKEIGAWWQFREGSKSLSQGKGEESLSSFGRSLDEIPQKARTLANMGLAFQVLQNPEKAENTYRSSLQIKSSDTEAQFMDHFNLGTLYALQQKTDQAIHEYQAALLLVPSSLQAKHNIELLIQQKQQQDQQDKNNKDDQEKDQDQKDQNKNQKDKDGKQDDKAKNDQKDKGSDQKKDDKNGDDKKKPEEKDKPQEKPKDYEQSQKYKPREFKGELHQQDVQKILGELKQQEKKIRADYNKKSGKEAPRDKDW